MAAFVLAVEEFLKFELSKLLPLCAQLDVLPGSPPGDVRDLQVEAQPLASASMPSSLQDQASVRDKHFGSEGASLQVYWETRQTLQARPVKVKTTALRLAADYTQA